MNNFTTINTFAATVLPFPFQRYPLLLSEHIEAYKRMVRQCTICGGPIHPVYHTGDFCIDCAAWSQKS